MKELDFSKHYRVEDSPGIAWYLHSPVMEREPECTGHPADYDDPMGETVYCDGSCNDEPIESDTQVYAVMVGDDRKHIIDIEDLVPIEEEDFCRDCGQIGCGHNIYS